LAGRRPFDAVHRYFESKVEPFVGHFTKVDPSQTGLFDVVLFLGVLYHMEDPVGAVRRAASFVAPGGLLCIESAAAEFPGAPDVPLLEFYPGAEFNADPTNWFAPNMRTIEGFTVAAGLTDFRILQSAPARSELRTIANLERARYRAIVSARNSTGPAE
jgi:tRNA (mo5U34)-methyltransferase